MKIWEEKTIIIPAEEVHWPEYIEKVIPIELIDPNTERSPFFGKELKVGLKSDDKNWLPIIEILEINKATKTVKIKQKNTNLLAWEDLTFKIKLLEIEKED